MNILTHGLAGSAIVQSGIGGRTRLATPMLITASVIADLDWIFYFGGAETYLAFHRVILHSLLGSVFLIFTLAASFTFLDRRLKQRPGSKPLAYSSAAMISAVGVASHLVLDLCQADGVQLLWPFRQRWFAWDLAPSLDLWLLVILFTGILLPALFRLISEEIGERRKSRGPRRGAILALVLATLYLGGRGTLHARAVNLLMSREYHGAAPLSAGAFPSGASPLAWRGICVFPALYRESEISLGSDDDFDPDRAAARYKPEPSPELSAASNTPVSKEFLRYARFPLANAEQEENGFRVEIRDLRFPAGADLPANVIAVVELDSQLRVKRQAVLFSAASRQQR